MWDKGDWRISKIIDTILMFIKSQMFNIFKYLLQSWLINNDTKERLKPVQQIDFDNCH